MKIFWFNKPIGFELFNNTILAYYKRYGTYPTVKEELPDFLNSLGYRVNTVQNTDSYRGFVMEDEDATYFLLKWL